MNSSSMTGAQLAEEIAAQRRELAEILGSAPAASWEAQSLCARWRMAPAELAAALGDNAEHPWKPPGGGLVGALTHDVIHGLDIIVALDIGRHVPAERLRIVLANVTEPNPLRYFGAGLDGIELHADDLDWSFGSGQRVSGSAQDLALVVCGRKLPAGRLRGASAGRFTAA